MILCEVSTKYGFATVLGILDILSEQHKDNAVLLISDHSVDSEIFRSLYCSIIGTGVCNKYFDKIYYLNDLIAPLHPAKWISPKNTMDKLAIRSILCTLLGVNKVETLLIESLHVAPAATLAEIFYDSELLVYSDGLMTYGPTRFKLPYSIGSKVSNLFYIDLLHGLKPNYLKEFHVNLCPVDPEIIKSKIKEISVNIQPELMLENDVPVFAGQYLSGLGIISEEEEVGLYVEGIVCAAKKGKINSVYFKPHPSFSSTLINLVRENALKKGINILVLPSTQLLEELMLIFKPAFVVSVFSTALATANAIFKAKSYSFRTEWFIRKLEPFQNSNRVPAYICLHVFEDIENKSLVLKESDNLQMAVNILSYGMQPSLHLDTNKIIKDLLLLEKKFKDPLLTKAFEIISAHTPEMFIPELITLEG